MLTSPRRALMTSFSASIALFLATACGGNGASGTDGDGGSTFTGGGGSGNGTSSSSSSSSSSSTSGSGGSAVACHPTEADPTAAACTDTCVCQPTQTSSPEWCSSMLQDPGVDACPSGCNTCSAGSNQCGYDLPKGEAYVAPDCLTWVNGDTWIDEFQNENTCGGVYDSNGQFRFAINLIGSGAAYFTGEYRLSGKKIYWNRANATSMESGEGEINDTCDTITVRLYKAGETTPYYMQSIYWLHD